jgi:hypothetical protein
VSTALADPPAAPAEQQPLAGANGGAPAPSPPASRRACSNCGAALADGQDWCLNCGAGAPDSLSSRTPTWRSAAVLLTTLAVLVAGAAGAAYAALDKGAGKPRPTGTTVAQAVVPPATATTPVTPPPAVATAPTIGAPTTIKPVIPLPKAKIPLTPSVTPTPTPKATTPITPSGSESGGATTPTTSTPKSSNEGPAVAGEAHPEALMLDTNAAQTYNPYNYAASNFGDPSLAIDGDTTTGWTALVEPSVAPKMAEGLAIDLNTPRRLSAVALTTSTPGMTVQVYGSSAAALPTSITDPAWVALTPSFVEHKRHVKLKLGVGNPTFALAAKHAYRFITLWISQAPAASVGTPQAPGHVSVNELELFPKK